MNAAVLALGVALGVAVIATNGIDSPIKIIVVVAIVGAAFLLRMRT